MTDTNTKQFYSDTYKKVLRNNKNLLFNNPSVSKTYIYDNTRYFKNALDEYYKYNKVYDTKNIPVKYRKVKGEEKPETRLGNNRFYTILSILSNYENNKCNTKEKDIFNLSDFEILNYKKEITELYNKLSVLQQPVHDTKYEDLADEIHGIPTKDSSDEDSIGVSNIVMEVVSDSSDSECEEGEEEDHILEEAMIEDKQLLVLKHLSKKKNIDFEELIKKEMPEFYKRENEKGRISKTLEYFESI
tara:strand:+ start:469 stop:1203 length:735 start_codon:yes stop_codon:yes gene_type:complete